MSIRPLLTNSGDLMSILCSLYRPPYAELKQIDCKIFLQKRWFIGDQQRIAAWGLQTWEAMCKFSHAKWRTHLWRGNKVGRAIANRESMAFHWMSSTRKEGELSSCCAVLAQRVRACPSSLPAQFSWAFCLQTVQSDIYLFIYLFIYFGSNMEDLLFPMYKEPNYFIHFF